MAKVTGPLYSMGASGKLGNALVFFPWKGLNVVREWLVPTNKESSGQGNVRIRFGGTGRAVGEVKPTTVAGATTKFAQQLITLGLIPGGQTKQSFLVKYIIDHYISTVALYTAELAAVVAHTRYSAFQSAADVLGIVAFDLGYASTDAYNKALGLYLLAKTAIALSFTGTPYTLALASWVTASVDAMINDFTASA
jgi:hypothetical protein